MMMTCQPCVLTRLGHQSLCFSQPNHVERIYYYLNTVLSVNTLRKYNTLCKYHGEMPKSNSSRQVGDLIGAYRWMRQCRSTQNKSGHCLVAKGAFDLFRRGNSNCLKWHAGCTHKSLEGGIPNGESKVLRLVLCI